MGAWRRTVFYYGKSHCQRYRRRALRSIIEKILPDIMYEIPKDDNVGRVTITREYIEGTSGPVIHIRGNHIQANPDDLPRFRCIENNCMTKA